MATLTSREAKEIEIKLIDFQKKLRDIIKSRGMTQKYVMEKLEMGHGSWNYRLNNCLFEPSHIVTICECLNL